MSWSEVSSIDTAHPAVWCADVPGLLRYGRARERSGDAHLRPCGVAVDDERRNDVQHGLALEFGLHFDPLGSLLRADDDLPAGDRVTDAPGAASAWDAFSRPRMRYGPYTYISGRDPLFVHQYSHAWFDFGSVRDRYANYFTNSVTATRAHKAFLATLQRGYNNDYWGVTASDWQHGYTAWGGPPLMGPVDGSVVPCATAGSLPFLPKPCVQVLRSLYDRYGQDAWGRYGFLRCVSSISSIGMTLMCWGLISASVC